MERLCKRSVQIDREIVKMNNRTYNINRIIKVLEIERECASRDCDRDCGNCDLVQEQDWLLSVYDDAIALLKEQQKLVDDTPHWVFGNSYGHTWMKCSNCCVSQSGQTSCWSYCPNCGAKMEGQVEWDD